MFFWWLDFHHINKFLRQLGCILISPDQASIFIHLVLKLDNYCKTLLNFDCKLKLLYHYNFLTMNYILNIYQKIHCYNCCINSRFSEFEFLKYVSFLTKFPPLNRFYIRILTLKYYQTHSRVLIIISFMKISRTFLSKRDISMSWLSDFHCNGYTGCIGHVDFIGTVKIMVIVKSRTSLSKLLTIIIYSDPKNPIIRVRPI